MQEQLSQEVLREPSTKHCTNKKCGMVTQNVDESDHITCKHWMDMANVDRPDVLLGSKCLHKYCRLCLIDYDGTRAYGNSHQHPGCAHHH